MGVSDIKRDVVQSTGLVDQTTLADAIRSSKMTRDQFLDELRAAKMDELSLNDEDARKKFALTAAKLGMKTAAKNGMDPTTPEYKAFAQSEAKRIFDTAQENAKKKLPARKNAIKQALNEGVLDSFLDPREIAAAQQAIAASKPINRSPTKAFIDFAKAAPDDRMLDILLKGFTASRQIAKGEKPRLADRYAHLTPEEVQSLAQMQTEEWHPDVAQEQGIVGKGTRILTTEARALGGALVRGQEALVNTPTPNSNVASRAAQGMAVLPISPGLAAVSLSTEALSQLGEHAPQAIEFAKRGLREIGAPLEEIDYVLRSKFLPPGLTGKVVEGLADYGPLHWPQLAEGALNVLAPTDPKATTFGAPAGDVAEKLRDPMTLLEVGGRAVEGAQEAIWAPYGEFSLEKSAKQGKLKMAKQASREAMEQFPGAPPEILQAQAKVNFVRLRNAESTSPATDSAQTLQTAGEFVVPSLAVEGAVKVGGTALGAGLRAARRTEAGAKFLDKAGDLVRWRNDANKLVAEAEAKGVTGAVKNEAAIAADLRRLAADRASARTVEVDNKLSDLIGRQAKLIKTPEEDALVWSAVHKKVPVEQLEPRLQEAATIQEELNKTMHEIGTEDGWLNRNDASGVLEVAPRREDYGAPHLVKKPHAGADVETSITMYKETPQAGMAKSRTAPMEAFEPSVLKANKAALQEVRSTSARAVELREMKALLGGKATTATTVEAAEQARKMELGTPPEAVPKITRGVVTHNIPAPKPAIESVKNPEGFVREGGWLIETPVGMESVVAEKMSKETGFGWSVVAGENADLFAMVSGVPGVTKKGAQSFVAPSPLVEAVNKLMPLAGNKGYDNAGGAVVAIMRNVVGPWSQMLRAGSTSLRAGMQWLGLNAATAPTFPMLAHGLRALDPSITRPALAAAVQLAGFGDDTARLMRVSLRSGREVNLGELMDVMERYGFVSQFDASLDLSKARAGGLRGASQFVGKWASSTTPLIPFAPVGVLPGKAGEVGRLLSTRNLAQGLDNYQRLATVIGFLDDLSPPSIAQAITKAGKYVGNYNRLSQFEREILGNTVFFYGWMKTAMGSFFTTLKENPKILADFAKTRLMAERESRVYAPPTSIPSYGIGSMYPSKLPPGGMIEFTAPQTPDVIGLSYLNMVENLFRSALPGSIDGPTGDKDLGDMLSPVIRNFLELINNVDTRFGGVAFASAPLDPGAYGSTGQMLDSMRRSTVGKIVTAPLAPEIAQVITFVDFLTAEKQYSVSLQVIAAYLFSRSVGAGNPLGPKYVANQPKNMAQSERRALDREQKTFKETSR